MMKYLTAFLFCASTLFYASNLHGLAGFESEHYPAEIWQREDGQYQIRILDGQEHDYVIPVLIHEEKCHCEWWKYED